MKITTLRTNCPDERSCVSIHAVDIHPDRRYVITKKVTDAAVIAAFRDRVGDDEQLGYGPAHMFPTEQCTCGGHR